jgi:hypothetical protein
MSARPRPAPPSGEPPPRHVRLGEEDLDLEALAAEVCARYDAEFPDERDRYGDAGQAWCRHDNQHLLNWAALDAAGFVVLDEQVAWLARVLESREFPLDRLARDLDIAADVIGTQVADGAAMAAALSDAAAMVRSRPTFL